MKAADVMADVVARLMTAIEQGAGEWAMPWRSMGTGGWPVNAVTGNRYSGGNVLALALTAMERGYPSNRWATFKQWASVGAQVRKGERGTQAIYWNVKPGETITETDTTTGETVELQSEDRVAWARTFVVFNAAQVDNDPSPTTALTLTPLERDARAEAFFTAIPADVRWGTGNPCYMPAADRVAMPAFDAFNSAPDAYATLAHEFGHWTGHHTRLARVYGRRFGDHAYAAEELVAELGAAFLCASLKISVTPRPDHAAYIAGWLEVLPRDKRAVFAAASLAQKAVDWMGERAGISRAAAT